MAGGIRIGYGWGADRRSAGKKMTTVSPVLSQEMDAKKLEKTWCCTGWNPGLARVNGSKNILQLERIVSSDLACSGGDRDRIGDRLKI